MVLQKIGACIPKARLGQGTINNEECIVNSLYVFIVCQEYFIQISVVVGEASVLAPYTLHVSIELVFKSCSNT